MNDNTGLSITIIVGLVLAFIGGFMAILPQYNVYSERLSGEAALAKVHATKQVLVTQAQAEKDAAVCRAQAEWNELERMSIEEETWEERL